MNKALFWQAMTKFSGGLLLTGALLFVSAGTFDYWQAWLLLGILFIPMFLAGLVMLRKAPELLQKRLNGNEKEPEQIVVILFSGLLFLATFVTAGLSRRFGWIIIPGGVSFFFTVVFLTGYALYAEVLRENRYLSRTIEVQQDQKVVDTGLYGVVRHPMYMSTLFLFLSMPLILGSLLSFAVMLLYIPVIGLRIRNEEKVLEEGLAGYAGYKKRIRYRLIPFIW